MLYDNSMKLLTFLNTLSFWDSQTPRVSILFLIEAFWLFTLIIMFLHNPRFTKHPLLLILLECFSALRIALSLIQKRHIPFSNVLPPTLYSARTRFCSSIIWCEFRNWKILLCWTVYFPLGWKKSTNAIDWLQRCYNMKRIVGVGDWMIFTRCYLLVLVYCINCIYENTWWTIVPLNSRVVCM